MTTTTRGSDTRSWWRLPRSEWLAVLKSTGGEFSKDEVANLAAVVTLRIVLALVPSLIAGVAIAAQVVEPGDIERLVSSADDLIPGESARDFVQTQLERALAQLQEDGAVAIALSILVGLFAASGAAAALINALNKAYDIEEGRGFIGQRLASLVVIAALALALAGMFVAIVLGPTLLELLLPPEVYESPLRWLIAVGRYVVAIALLMAFYGFTFWYAPNRERHRLRFLTPGAVFGVVMWLLLSWLFGLYVSFSGTYAETYGAVAGIIVLLIWLNYSFVVLFMGAELDHEMEKHLDSRAAPDRAIDLDAVTDDMPRHAGLVRGAGEDDDGSEGGGGAAPRGARTSRRPRLVGAAAKTSGAGMAAALWGRMGGDRSSSTG